MKVNKTIFFIFLISFFLVGLGLNAQPNLNRMEAIRLNFVKQRLNLKPEQTAKFEATYLEYIRKKRQIIRAEKTLKTNSFNLTATDEDLIKAVDEFLKLKKQEFDIEIEYKEKFLKIINIRQLVELYVSEKELVRTMLQKMGNQLQNLEDTNDD